MSTANDFVEDKDVRATSFLLAELMFNIRSINETLIAANSADQNKARSNINSTVLYKLILANKDTYD